MIVPYCTRQEFDHLTRKVQLQEPMRKALRTLLVRRSTWASAAQRHGVTQSGMLKALRRISATSSQEIPT